MKEALLLEKVYTLLVWITERIAKFPKDYKYTIGNRLSERSFDLLEECIAAYAARERNSVRKVSGTLDCVRYYLRFSKDLKLISIEQYGFASEKINEIGKIVGGWIKARTNAQ